MPSIVLPAPLRPPPPSSPIPPPRPSAPPAVWVLVVGASLIRAGGFVYPFLPYRLADLGFSTRGISTALAAFGVGWLVGQILWGRLSDALGRRATLVTAMVLAAIVLPLLAWATAPVAIAAASVVAGACYDAPRPVISAVITDSVPDADMRASLNGWRHFGINIGAAVTGATGGLVLDSTGLPVLFCINGAVCAALALTVLVLAPSDRPAPRVPVPHADGTAVSPLRDRQLWLLWLASLGALMPVAGLASTLPLLMADAGLPASAFGWTQVASAVAVLVLSTPLNTWLSRRARSSSLVGLLAVSSLVLGAGIGSAGLASSPLEYTAAAVIAVPGEITAFVAASTVLDRITPAHARGLYAGVWGSTLASAVICAPVLAGWSLTHGGPGLVGITTVACGVLGTAVCLPLAALVNRPQFPPVSPR
ncbi:MFS transporter [Streptomyces sp. NPDC059224]|uniref:MFS transporter n=1 Tax=Streptomyces sp. NPDC059224 TaxID=3346775 RepID=UPI0036807FA6